MNHTELAPERIQVLTLSRLTNQLRAPKTILLVEDEAFVREITCEILESAGYRVLKARNAAAAKNIFEHYGNAVQLLLTDVVLPGQNGRDLANELRTMNSGLRVIFISGYPENVVSQTGNPADRMFYLPKPFSSESLLRKVWELLTADLDEIAI